MCLAQLIHPFLSFSLGSIRTITSGHYSLQNWYLDPVHLGTLFSELFSRLLLRSVLLGTVPSRIWGLGLQRSSLCVAAAVLNEGGLGEMKRKRKPWFVQAL